MQHVPLVVVLGLAVAFVAGCAAPATPTPAADAADPSPDSPDAGPAPAQGQGPDAQSRRANGSDPAGEPAAAALGEPSWASLDAAAIHPGIQTFTEGAQCTANFVFWAANGTGHDLYVGQAAHCAATGAATDTNGCTADSLPLGTQVDLGTGHPGVLAYSSWLAMQEAGTDPAAPECFGNDVALVRIDEADEASVSPEVPFFGGPTGLTDVGALGTGDEVYSFGNSGLRAGIEPVLSWKHGTVVSADGWVADVYTATPGVPGDSGSGFLTAEGGAWGILSTVAVLPLPLSNQVSGLAPALDYAAAHGGPSVVLGTAPWAGGIA